MSDDKIIFSHGIELSKEIIEKKISTGVKVGVIMGSRSDWPDLAIHCCQTLEELGVDFEYGVVSAHRTDERMNIYAQSAQARGLEVIIACAGGSAHLPGMMASKTLLSVLAFGPISVKFGPMDVLGSTVRMPAGIPLAMMGLDRAGAINAALGAVKILALNDKGIMISLADYMQNQTDLVKYTVQD